MNKTQTTQKHPSLAQMIVSYHKLTRADQQKIREVIRTYLQRLQDGVR